MDFELATGSLYISTDHQVEKDREQYLDGSMMNKLGDLRKIEETVIALTKLNTSGQGSPKILGNLFSADRRCVDII